MSSNPSKSQRDSLTKQFISVTRASTSDASRFLKKHNWRLDPAIDGFYSDSGSSTTPSSNSGSGRGGTAVSAEKVKERLEALWADYADPSDSTKTSIDGTMKYCSDLGIEIEDPVMIALSQLCGSPSMGVFDKTKWTDAWKGLKKDSLDAQKTHIPALRETFEDEEAFRKLYSFTFDWAKSQGQRALQCETAIGLWQLLIPAIPRPTRPGFPDTHLELWCKFLQEKGGKAVSRDTWNLFLDFVKTIDETFSTHDIDAAWPAVVDDFVEWAKPKVSTANEGSSAGGEAMDTS